MPARLSRKTRLTEVAPEDEGVQVEDLQREVDRLESQLAGFKAEEKRLKIVARQAKDAANAARRNFERARAIQPGAGEAAEEARVAEQEARAAEQAARAAEQAAREAQEEVKRIEALERNAVRRLEALTNSELNRIYPRKNTTNTRNLDARMRSKSKRIKGTTTLNRVEEVIRGIRPNQSSLNSNLIVPRYQYANLAEQTFHRFEFNLMYLIDPEVSKKYYEIYTTYQMLLNSLDNLRYIMTMNRNELYQMVEITENIDFKNAVYDRKVIDATELRNMPIVSNLYSKFAGGNTDISYLFGLQKDAMETKRKSKSNEEGGQSNRHKRSFRSNINTHFLKYLSNQALFSFEEVGKSQSPIFQYLIKNYVSNRDLKKVLLDICESYRQFKMKILNALTVDNTTIEREGKVMSTEGKTVLFGLMTYGFLFTNEYFPKIHSTDPNNIFMDSRLYDMGGQNVDVSKECIKLSKRIFEMGENFKSKLSYFYSGQYRNTILFELLMTAMDLDLAGLQMPLYYAHPEYLKLFIKRKSYIDRQISNYIGNYNAENVSTGFNAIPVYKGFIDEESGLFKSYDQYLAMK